MSTAKTVSEKKTLTKTVRQYSAEPVPLDVMGKLLPIAADYCAVKNYVYQRYSGVRSLNKLYPGYTVQNEMTKSGLRKKLGISVAYFYPAIFEALVDIRNQWERDKAVVSQRARNNENFSDADRHFLSYVLSVDKIFICVLNRLPIDAPAKFCRRYEEFSRAVDAEKLENYLRRQIRKVHTRPKADTSADRFTSTVDGYRYAEHGIYLATKEYRKRVFIPLTDNNSYTRQIEVRLRPETNSVEIQVPLEVRIRQHQDYIADIGLAMGMSVMLTTHEGHIYGEDVGRYQRSLNDWLREEHSKYQKNHLANPGRKKYEAEKKRREEHLHSYINQELNRFLRTEKPKAVYIMKFPQSNKRCGVKTVNYSVGVWQRGYIRKQLMLKCRENSVELIEIFGKGIGIECSRCGKTGRKVKGIFFCECGYTAPEKQNAAQNAKKRGYSLTKRPVPNNHNPG